MIKTTQRFYTSTNAVIVAAKRTPVGSFMGAFKDLSAPQLGMAAAKGAIASCNLDPKEIQEVYFGNVMSAGLHKRPDVSNFTKTRA